MSKQRALITGVAGMVGSHLTDFLLENTFPDLYFIMELLRRKVVTTNL